MNIQNVLWKGPDWSDEAVEFVSKQVTEILFAQSQRTIVVPNDAIREVLNSQMKYYRPKTGDIFTRYNLEETIPDGLADSLTIMKMSIDVIVAAINGEISQDLNQACFSAWPLPYIQRHEKVKLNLRRPAMRFNVRF